MKRCPFCSESIVDTATVCGRCKNPLPVGGGARPVSSSASAAAGAVTAGSATGVADRRPLALGRPILIVAVICLLGVSLMFIRSALKDPEGPGTAQADGPITEIPVLTASQARLQTGVFGRVLSAVALIPKSAVMQRRERAIVYFAGEGIRVARESCSNGAEVMRVGGELSKVTRDDAGYVLARASLTQLEACRLVIVMRAIPNPVDEGLERSFLQ
jgi:hypothetical protein